MPMLVIRHHSLVWFSDASALCDTLLQTHNNECVKVWYCLSSSNQWVWNDQGIPPCWMWSYTCYRQLGSWYFSSVIWTVQTNQVSMAKLMFSLLQVMVASTSHSPPCGETTYPVRRPISSWRWVKLFRQAIRENSISQNKSKTPPRWQWWAVVCGQSQRSMASQSIGRTGKTFKLIQKLFWRMFSR